MKNNAFVELGKLTLADNIGNHIGADLGHDIAQDHKTLWHDPKGQQSHQGGHDQKKDNKGTQDTERRHAGGCHDY